MTVRTHRDEHGLVLVWVALMMVVFLGAGALVIDVGAFRREKRELQNGADAGALAVAKDCAQLPSCSGGAVSLAQTFANSNAHDATSAVGGVCGSGGGLSACPTSPAIPAGTTGWVQVSVSTRTVGGGSEVEFVLAPIAGAISGKTANAAAIAAWGPAGAANTPPLVFAQCAYNFAVPGGTLPSASTTLYFHNPTNETYTQACAAGVSPPGGFGWTATAGCAGQISASGGVQSAPGNGGGARSDCFARAGGTGMYQPGDTVPVGVFSSYSTPTGNGGGANVTYQLVGIAAFEITSYRFTGVRNPAGYTCPISNQNSCLTGRFTKLVTVGDFGGGTNFGVSVIKMIG